MATETGVRFETESFTGLHWAGVALALASGLIHLVLGVRSLASGTAVGLGAAFVLAGLGFFGAVALLLMDVRRRLLYAVGVPFVGVQILLYIALRWPNVEFSAVSAIDKVAQVVLIGILLVLFQRSG